MKLMRICVEMPTRIVGPALVACAVLALTIPVSAQNAGQAGGSPAETVAIVPFTNLTENPSDDWIGAGIAESLATGLPGSYMVIARGRVSETANDANRGGGTAAPDEALEVGRRLGAQYVVSGAYQRLGEEIRITGRLVEVATGAVVRSAKVDGVLDDLFSLQDRVVAELSSPSPRAAAAAAFEKSSTQSR